MNQNLVVATFALILSFTSARAAPSEFVRMDHVSTDEAVQRLKDRYESRLNDAVIASGLLLVGPDNVEELATLLQGDVSYRIEEFLRSGLVSTIPATQAVPAILAAQKALFESCSISGKIYTSYETKKVGRECHFMNVAGEILTELREEHVAQAFLASDALTWGTIRSLWSHGSDELDRNLDQSLLRPVRLKVEPSSALLRRIFRMSSRFTSEVSTGKQALEDFFSAQDGPDASRSKSFRQLKELLQNSGAREFRYYSGSGEEWTTNVLIVIDRHGQAFAFQMGYSV